MKLINPKDKLGIKKPQLSLIPGSSLIELSKAMKNGADKYGPYNWREHKVNATIYVDAALRHLILWADGENKAEDSGVDHRAHVMACMAILIDADSLDQMVDNRPLKGQSSKLMLDKS